MAPRPAAKTHPESGSDVVHHLNAALRHALTSINQYFLHARLLKHQGVMKLADREYKESIDTMRRSDRVVERILALGGKPELQEQARVHIGDTPEQILRADLALEQQAIPALQAAMAQCETSNDEASKALLHDIYCSAGNHIAFLEQQLTQIASMGEAAYLRSQS